MDLTPFEKPDEDHKLSEKQLDDKYKNAKPFFVMLHGKPQLLKRMEKLLHV